MGTTLDTALSDRYQITRELGQGGMATVYLARDVRHDRLVALKVMRPELLAVIGAQRFLAEIKTTASLQHPHILPLHDSGEVNGTVFYVMPFVEGESLRDRLTRDRQLPVDDAVRIAREVAGALDYAHRRGVIHRDIKPENILLHEGQALVADFGIALAVSRLESGTRMTETGMSLGTPHYMSPEQAMGERVVDARADVYALGCVLYEMLSGEPPFTGPTAQAIVARVLTETPRSLRAQRQTIPPSVDAAVRKALQKLPADRFGSAAELVAALNDSSFQDAVAPDTPAAPRSIGRWRAAALVLGLTTLVAGSIAVYGWLTPPPERTSWSFVTHPPGEEGRFAFGGFALAPDGESYVYMGPGEGGTTQLWVKRRDELRANPIRGTSGGFYPFFSPDGKWLAFYSGERIMKVPTTGGAPAPVATGAMIARWAAWLPNDEIVFGSFNFTLVSVPAAGGEARTRFTLPASNAAYGAVVPIALPGTRGDFLFAACTASCGARQMWVYDGRKGEGRLLLDNAYPFGFAEGHVLYGLAGAMFAAPFDLGRLELTGPGVPLLDDVLLAQLSDNGTMLYTEGLVGGEARVELVTRDGVGTPIDSTWRGSFVHLSLSPDGRRVALDEADGNRQTIQIREIEGGTISRLTFDDQTNMRPVWHPDGTRVAWVVPRDSTSLLYVKRADGVGQSSQLIADTQVWEAEWSRDGAWIVYRKYGRDDADDLYAVRTQGDTTPVPVSVSRFYERGAAISPDGRYVAYVSNESSRDEIYVRPFPNAEANRWIVSAGGGTEPRWSPTGTELFYVSDDNALVSVSVTLGDRFTHQAPRTLFSVRSYAREANSRAYDVMPDGKRFVMLRGSPAEFGAPVLVEHWVAELRRKLGR